MSDFDRLEEARNHVIMTVSPAEYIAVGQLNALIDIAESLRKIANPPQYITKYAFDVVDSDALRERLGLPKADG